MSVTETVASRPNPYVGTRPFQKGEILYGRERETSELLDLLIAERIVMLYSPSGAGKSSLLNAAIFPKMDENGFEVLPVMRFNHEPPPAAESVPGFNRYVFSLLMCLEESVGADQRFPSNELATFRLKDYLAHYRERAKRLNPDYDLSRSTLMVIDQGEEVITIDPTERQAKQLFFNQLGETLRDRNLWLLFSMREDFIARMDSYIKPIPTGLATRYRLRLLAADAALDAIQKPAARQGVTFSTEAAQKMTNDLRMMQVQQADGTSIQEAGLYVEPVQLQVVCRRLWSSLEHGSNEIGVADLEKIGDVNTALADYYSLQIATVAAKVAVRERFIRAWFDRKLITPQGIRGQVLLAPTRSDGLENKAIWELERSYLVRSEKRGGATWFELSHDRLIEPIRKNNLDWFDKNLSALQRHADVWNQENRPRGTLATGSEFLEMQKWAEANRDEMSQVEVDFYTESQKAHEAQMREVRTNRIIRWLFAASVIGFLVTMVMFFRARIAEQNAVARGLAAASSNTLSSDPELSLMLALASQNVTGDITLENIRALHRALPIVHVEYTLSAHRGSVNAVAFSPDGKLLASGAGDGMIKIWDAGSGKELHSLQVLQSTGVDYGVTNTAFSPNGKSLAVATEYGDLILYDTQTWQETRKIPAHKTQLWGLAFSPDGSLLATGSSDHTVKLWDAASGVLLTTFGTLDCMISAACGDGHTSRINTLAFSPDGKLLASAGEDRVLRVWDVAAEKSAFVLTENAHTAVVWAIIFSPDGKHLASASDDRLIKIWDLTNRQWTMDIPGHAERVYSLAYTPDGKTLYSAGGERVVYAWDTTYGRLRDSLPGHTNQIYNIALSPDGQTLASAGEDQTVRVWNTGASGSREIFTGEDSGRINIVAYSQDGSLLASGGGSTNIKIWNAQTGVLLNTLSGHEGGVEGLAWGPGDAWLVSGSRDTRAIVWDVGTGSQKLVFAGHKSAVWSVALAPDASFVVSGDNDGIVYVWAAKSGQVVQTLTSDNPESGPVLSVGISPDQKWVAGGYIDKSVLIWDAASGKLVYKLTDHTDKVQSVYFSQDGSLLASVGDDGKLILTDMRANPPSTLSTTDAHRGLIYDVVFARAAGPGGDEVLYAVTAGADGNVNVRDVSDPKKPVLAYSFSGFTERVLSLAADPRNGHIAAGGAPNVVRVYTMNTDELMSQARSRLTRSISEAECEEYFDATCAEFDRVNLLDRFTFFIARLFR